MPATPHLQPGDSALDPAGWVDRHGDYLYRFALRVVRRPEAAEDLVQDTLMAAWRNRAGYRGWADERTWLTAVLKRKAVDWLRRTVRERAAGPQPGDPADGSFTPRSKWAAPPRRWAAPDTDCERAELWDAVRGCADKLPPRLRAVFVLRHLDDEPAEAVCAAADVTLGNLWVMLHRARHGLWLCLSRSGFGEAPPPGKAGAA